MWRAVVVFLALSGAPQLAAAQTADLQAIGQAAAAKYGVPWNIFQAQIQGESGWNPNIGCNATGACGLGQFIPGTAAQYGVNVSDATSSLYGAAQYDAALFQQTGSWAGALTKYTGGLTPANPGNPSYATAFADAQAIDSGLTLGNGTLAMTPDGAAAAPTTAGPAVPAAPAILSRPFQWAWDHIMQQAQANVGNVIGQVQQVAYLPFIALGALAGVVWGVRFWAGRMEWGDALIAVFTLGIVGSLVFPGNTWYANWVGFAEGLPAYFASHIGSMNAAGPAGVFDSVWQAFWIKIVNTWHTSPWEKILLTGLLLFFVAADIATMLGSMFFTFLMANFILYILLAVGAVFILGLLFPGTHGFFRFWIDLIVAVLIYILILDVMLSFFITVMNQLLDATGGGHTPWSDMLPNLMGAVIIFNIMAGVNAFLALQIGRLHGAGSAAMSRGWSSTLAGYRAIREIA
jgi:TrbL/VirB6 plasmid conjugal transfer protein/Transglycosylase SLT domain